MRACACACPTLLGKQLLPHEGAELVGRVAVVGAVEEDDEGKALLGQLLRQHVNAVSTKRPVDSAFGCLMCLILNGF